MLTLSRRPGERLLIGGDIEIFVVSIVGGAVKLAIRAPRHVRVLRDELVLRLPTFALVPDSQVLDPRLV